MSKTIKLTEVDICDRIRDKVLEQRLAPGTKLTEEALCEVFGVSRNLIRRAFLLLSKDNIITLEKNKGAAVASPSPSEAHEIFEARTIMENALLKQAMERANKASIKALRAHLDREQQALMDGDTPLWIRLSGEFHIVLGRAAQNAPMSEFLDLLVFRSSLILALYGNQSAPTSCKGGEHERLVDALENKDLETARQIMAEHMASLEALLKFDTKDTGQDLHSILGG
ncbi:MAG: GntR family transcriptional regulator [Kordiimonadaceae bacterium]|nr:GntR family transcriptional regulator [Kordiimonadaceae bacterium]